MGRGVIKQNKNPVARCVILKLHTGVPRPVTVALHAVTRNTYCCGKMYYCKITHTVYITYLCLIAILRTRVARPVIVKLLSRVLLAELNYDFRG